MILALQVEVVTPTAMPASVFGGGPAHKRTLSEPGLMSRDQESSQEATPISPRDDPKSVQEVWLEVVDVGRLYACCVMDEHKGGN